MFLIQELFAILCSYQVTEICCYVYRNRNNCVKLCTVYSFCHHFANIFKNMQSAPNLFLHFGLGQKATHKLVWYSISEPSSLSVWGYSGVCSLMSGGTNTVWYHMANDTP